MTRRFWSAEFRAIRWAIKRSCLISRISSFRPGCLSPTNPSPRSTRRRSGAFASFSWTSSARGRRLLLSSHLISEMEKICESFVILKRGRVIVQEGLEFLRENHVFVRLPKGFPAPNITDRYDTAGSYALDPDVLGRHHRAGA